jgi:glycosyltransferase involved in cell wall biosynthesis
LSLWKIIRVRPQFIFGRNIVAGALGAITGYPAVIEIHAPVERMPRLDRILLGFAVKRKKLVGLVVISPPIKSSLEKAYGGVAGKKILVAPDAADKIDTGKARLPLQGQGKFNAGYLGQLSAGRGIDLIQKMAIGNKRVDFHVIGGNEADILYWRRRCADTLNIHFHGFIPHGEAVKTLKSFDLLIAPYQKIVSVYGKGDTSKWMSPMKIFEYMAARKPILCSNIEILHEILDDQESCIFCDPDSVESWNQAIQKIEGNQEYGKYLAENAYQKFLNQFTWQARAENILDQFDFS